MKLFGARFTAFGRTAVLSFRAGRHSVVLTFKPPLSVHFLAVDAAYFWDWCLSPALWVPRLRKFLAHSWCRNLFCLFKYGWNVFMFWSRDSSERCLRYFFSAMRTSWVVSMNRFLVPRSTPRLDTAWVASAVTVAITGVYFSVRQDLGYRYWRSGQISFICCVGAW